MQAILAGTCIGAHPAGAHVNAEFEAVHQAGRIRNFNRRRILEVLHSARALDSGLKAFVQHHGCQEPGKQPPNAMGGYLHALQKHTVLGLGQITGIQRSQFQASIVSKRNTFLHEAGAFPVNDMEVDALLSEMHTCLTTVVAL
jgi:hypothetical protein